MMESVCIFIHAAVLCTCRMVESELFPCLRYFGIRFYAYNPVSLTHVYLCIGHVGTSNIVLIKRLSSWSLKLIIRRSVFGGVVCREEGMLSFMSCRYRGFHAL